MSVRQQTAELKDLAPQAANMPLETVSSHPPARIRRVIEHVQATNFRTAFRFGSRASFFALVLLPSLLVAFYNFVVASDQYASTASFIVRGAQKSALSGLGSLLQSTGFTAARDEGYSIMEFMKSRDGLAYVNDGLKLREILGRNDVDFLSRFPGIAGAATEEDLFRRYKSMVDVTIDGTTGIVTLLVKAFDPTDAQRIADRLLEGGEHLVNRINERAQTDAIGFAGREVARVRQELIEAQQALTVYRLKTGMVEPKTEATGIADLVKGLTIQKLQVDAQISNMQVTSPNSPQLGSLRTTADSLSKQIAATQAKLVGVNNSLVNQVSEYERLALNVEFLNKSFVAVQATLDSARADAAKKQVYLERIVNPNTPDKAEYPRRAFNTFVVAISIFFAYAMLWLVLVNVREHAN